MVERVIGIIGGSGLYQMEGLTGLEWRKIQSPFGPPSDALCCGRLGGVKVVFLPRHGRGHKLPPGEIDYRANIDALKRAGVTDIISLSAVGSFREALAPGTFVLVDQFIDRTFAREKSFFGTGLVAHVSMAHPVCHRLGEHLHAAAQQINIPVLLGEPERLVKQRLAAGQPTWRNPTERDGKLIWYSPSVGTEPLLADVILERVKEACRSRGDETQIGKS